LGGPSAPLFWGAKGPSFLFFCEPPKKKRKPRVVKVNNTNFNLLKEYKEIAISKTGFTNAAGKCLVMYLTKHGEKYTIVILGERNTQSVQRVSRKIIERL
jgi:D-alanyl-D-alanine carboxypeptidase